QGRLALGFGLLGKVGSVVLLFIVCHWLCQCEIATKLALAEPVAHRFRKSPILQKSAKFGIR
ncbi:MAG: hypothetical protein ACI92S_003607, partial [Planctomycetaceae bacterium]